MSDKPIGEGDVVRVVKWPCCGHFVGVTRLITDVNENTFRDLRCTICGTVNEFVGAIGSDRSIPAGQKHLCSFPLAWVKRIDPPALPESTTHHEELPECIS